MSTLTLAAVEDRFGVTHLEHLDRAATVPTVATLAAQGDVLIRRAKGHATTPIPKAGFPAVMGENGGNTHLLVGAGFYYPRTVTDPSDLVIGTLTVPEGAEVLLSHPEHGGLMIAPGSYELRRQREQRDVIEFVQD